MKNDLIKLGIGFINVNLILFGVGATMNIQGKIWRKIGVLTDEQKTNSK
jgi:hypothetical protein